jgi:hypothetical protein
MKLSWLWLNFCEFISVMSQDVQYWRHKNGKLTQNLKENEGEKWKEGLEGRARNTAVSCVHSGTGNGSGICLFGHWQKNTNGGHFGGGAPTKITKSGFVNLRRCWTWECAKVRRSISTERALGGKGHRPEPCGKEPDDAHAHHISLMGYAFVGSAE